MIQQPPTGTKVNWAALIALQTQADLLKKHNALSARAFARLWRQGKKAAEQYPAALQTLKMLAPADFIAW
jgi:hypothetical protein